MTILVTGGAGYIGSHMVHLLRRSGRPVAVIDNFSTGHRAALPVGTPLLEADIADRGRVRAFIEQHAVTAVMHFASRIQVGESVRDPRLYYVDNLASTIALLESAMDAGVRRFIFSSSAAVYGIPTSVPIVEDHATAPINPYGETKLAIEKMLASYTAAYGLSHVALRYFNAAGADWERGLGEKHDPESHLIPLILDVPLGRRPHVTVFGDDYDTADGTCVRDYIHVLDLAEAHLAALRYLERGGASGCYNLGTGTGHTVMQVIEAARAISGHPIPALLGLRRAGDPPFLVASPRRAEHAFGWQARCSSLTRIVEDAWRWHQSAFGHPSASRNQQSEPRTVEHR